MHRHSDAFVRAAEGRCAGLASQGARERWAILEPALPRTPWTAEVTEKLLSLDPPVGIPVPLDAIVAAHALASERAVLTVEKARFEGMPGVRVEELVV